MAWHILHGLLEQVRVHSTFPGKLWIIMMFIFRIVIVARIGDMVYHDEQANFICNTLTPGCPNVCFNGFSPISQLRYWSLMVLVVAVPGIFFFVYATHKIYHAHIKFPDEDQDEEDRKRSKWDAGSDVDTYIHPPSMKRRRDPNNLPPSFANATAPPLYEVKKLNSTKKNGKEVDIRMREMDGGARKRKYRSNRDEDKDLLEKRKGSTTDNNYTPTEDFGGRKWFYGEARMGYPVYTDARGTKVEYIKKPKQYSPEIKENKEKKLLLENPALYRAYWWHVVFRTALEVGFLVGQYYLYGWMVPELYLCEREPCNDVVYCYVSRPMEKSCLMWIMYALGATACLLSIAEFWTLGFKKFRIAVCCVGESPTFEAKRRQLARYHPQVDGHSNKPPPVLATGVGEPPVLQRNGFTVSLDSLSSATTVESV